MRREKWNVYKGWCEHYRQERWYATEPGARLCTGWVADSHREALAKVNEVLRAQAGVRSGADARLRPRPLAPWRQGRAA